MNRVKNIKKEVQNLDPAELETFRKWFYEFDAEAWDRQIEEDVQTGKLDDLAEAAIKEFKSGRCSEL